MKSGLPDHISTVVFDVGNTLHHLDHAFIAEAITRHARPVTTQDVALAEYSAKADELALDACGAAPSEALYVGDIYEIDVRGARGAGMAAVLVDPLHRYGTVDCARIAALTELLALLPQTPRRGSVRQALSHAR